MSGWDEKSDRVSVSRNAMKELLQIYLEKNTKDLDSAWYQKTYPDISRAIKSGTVKTAKEHYYKYGYFEDRLPGVRTIEPDKYLSLHADIQNTFGHLNKRERKTAVLKHVVEFGYKEGRKIQ